MCSVLPSWLNAVLGNRQVTSSEMHCIPIIGVRCGFWNRLWRGSMVGERISDSSTDFSEPSNASKVRAQAPQASASRRQSTASGIVKTTRRIQSPSSAIRYILQLYTSITQLLRSGGVGLTFCFIRSWGTPGPDAGGINIVSSVYTSTSFLPMVSGPAAQGLSFDPQPLLPISVRTDHASTRPP